MLSFLLLPILALFATLVCTRDYFEKLIPIGCANVSQPAKCSNCYFQDLQTAFISNFNATVAASPILTSDYCRVFSSYYNISLGIMNQEGSDMCSAINPAAHLFTTFLTELNMRNVSNRFVFYKNINTTFDATSVGFDNIQFFDALGLLKFYVQVFFDHTNQQALAALYENLYNITQYPNDGYQNVTTIAKQTTQSKILETIPYTAVENILETILSQQISFNIVGSVLSDDIMLLFLLLIALQSSESSIESFYQILDQEITILSQYSASINNNKTSNNFNVQNGACTWKFETDCINGLSYKITFNQTKSNDD